MRTKQRALPVLVAIGLLATAACTGPEPAGPAVPTPTGAAGPTATITPGRTPTDPAPAGASLISCAHVIDHLDAPPTDRVVAVDVVAVPVRLLEVHPAGQTGPARLFAKTGLVVRADSTVDLSVPPASAGRTVIGWGSPAEPARQVRFPGCPDRTGWVAFAGGFWLHEPACVPLTVRSGGRTEQVRMSIGVDCPK
ncbi:hypothetical protein I0C86_36285 [Plantactinospora sp. S1510]|uniref:Lipoprotein n=1 Tax=Plantactinospora alkalitolerans TaxID=2789879 RepID=A0ABS0H7A6_9ACTN|nr:hypothetical protein [Plantactinospora alkalitolerans]MBF9134350.1 hypothetical protein [Plantactinospora alkalitolerans]